MEQHCEDDNSTNVEIVVQESTNDKEKGVPGNAGSSEVVVNLFVEIIRTFWEPSML